MTQVKVYHPILQDFCVKDRIFIHPCKLQVYYVESKQTITPTILGSALVVIVW